MDNPLIISLAPLVILAITELAKKINVSPKIMAALLSLVLGIGYYVLSVEDPELVEKAITVALGSLAAATVVYDYIIKFMKDKLA